MIRLRPALAGIPDVRSRAIGRLGGGKFHLSDVVKLASNEAPFGPFPAALAAIAEAATGRQPLPRCRHRRALSGAGRSLRRGHRAGAGRPTVRSSCAGWHAPPPPDPGDEIVYALALVRGLSDPRATGRRRRACGSRCVDARHHLDAMADAMTDRTRLVFVCTPNNPTGTTVGPRRGRAFLDRVPPDLLVVFDEAYREFVSVARLSVDGSTSSRDTTTLRCSARSRRHTAWPRSVSAMRSPPAR